jgi:hypothetical protein
MINLFTKYIPIELLYHLSTFLIEPSLIITNIGWDRNNKYKLSYSQSEANKLLSNFDTIINYYITTYKLNNIYSLYEHIYFLNTSLRKFTATYTFVDDIFKKYPYITYKSLIELEFDTELDLIKKTKIIEKLHKKNIKFLQYDIINQLNYYITKFNDFKYIHSYNIESEEYKGCSYPFHLYILDILILNND